MAAASAACRSAGRGSRSAMCWPSWWLCPSTCPSLRPLRPGRSPPRLRSTWSPGAGFARRAPRPAAGAGRVGPLDLADRQRLADLAAALPTEAFAVILASRGAVRVQAPEAAVQEFLDAVADRLVRTAAAGDGGRGSVRKPGRPLGAGRGGGRLARWAGLRPRRRRHPRPANHLARWPRRTACSRGAAAQSGRPQPGRRRLRALVGPGGGPRTPRRGRRGRPPARPAPPVEGVAAGGPLLHQPRPEMVVVTDDEAMDLLGPLGGRGDIDGGRGPLASASSAPGRVHLRAVVGTPTATPTPTPTPAPVAGAGLAWPGLVDVRLEATIDGRR